MCHASFEGNDLACADSLKSHNSCFVLAKNKTKQNKKWSKPHVNRLVFVPLASSPSHLLPALSPFGLPMKKEGEREGKETTGCPVFPFYVIFSVWVITER